MTGVEDLKRFVGQTVSQSIFEIEKEPIRRFADAVDDLNLLYWDEEYAQNSRYGSIIAPPGFVLEAWYAERPVKWGRKDYPAKGLGRPELVTAFAYSGYVQVVIGDTEVEFFQPVRAGDTIRAESIIKEIIERKGRSNKTAYLTIETTYTNQKNEVLTIARTTSIHTGRVECSV